MLADLVLSDLPLEVLLAIKHAITEEILKRKKSSYVSKRLQALESSNFAPSKHYPSYEEAIAALIETNSKNFLSIPAEARRQHFRDRMRYLPCLIAQDWRSLFPSANTVGHYSYVYTHLDPSKGRTELTALEVLLQGAPFYIGKGTERRAWDLKRNQGHGKFIKQIREDGFPDNAIVKIIADNLTEQDALALEAKLIYLFGSIYDKEINGCLVNLVDHIKPHFLHGMTKLPSRKPYERRVCAK